MKFGSFRLFQVPATFFVFFCALQTGCTNGTLSASSSTAGASGISGQILFANSNTASAAAKLTPTTAAVCSSPTISLWSLSLGNKLGDLAISTKAAANGNFTFQASQVASLDLSSATVKYVLRVQGCDQDYSRPLTGVSAQNISFGSSLFGLSVNSNGADLSRVSVRDAANVLQSVEGLAANSEAAALSALIESPQASRDFFAINSGSPASLFAAMPNAKNPTVQLDSLPASVGSDSSISVTIAGTPGSLAIDHFECTLDTAVDATCVSPIVRSSLGVGSHNLSVRAVDQAGNFSPTVKISWTIVAPPASRMYVDGNIFRNADGSRFIAKGSVLYVMAYDDGYNEQEWTNTLSKRDAIFAKMQSLGINTVRIPISNNSPTVVAYAGGATAYLNSLDLLIQSAHAHGLSVDLCWWGPLFNAGNWPTTYSSYLPFFDAAVTKWGNDPLVYFEPANEPNGVTWAQWQTAMQAYIRRFRADGYVGPLLIDTINWSWSFDPAQAQTLTALDASLLGGKSNLIFSNHQYANNNSCFNCGTVQSSWETAIGQYTRTFPILSGEVGSYNGSSFANSTTWYSQFLAYLSGTKINDGLNGGYVFAWHWADTNSNTNADYVTLGSVGQLANANFWLPLK